ncbi:NAD(P)-binding Rossmann-fold superfamily protein [Citrus sinensis]|uniref:NAD(P)-binding Rossmann-fold superfamily protein n=1 Tax=Citrus sinensis TaxID=2711 RepID=A0ACB8IA28_CITSI|nr:NAD(P)-binding Rossmann-fold superfamily protein [Citrus sinensis]
MGIISRTNTVSLNGACTGFFAADSLSSKASSVFFNNTTWKLKLRPLVASSSSSSSMATNFQVTASSSIGAVKEEQKGASSGRVGENDLLIVGPGVLGRLVAEQWRQEHPGCQIYGQTMTADHHDELINMGITPSLKWTEATQKFPYVIFCAPPSRSLDYPGDVRLAALSWNGEGSFLFTSTSAIFDCSDNGACDEDGPVVPIGRSPRTDVLLKAEKDAASLSIAMLKKKIRGQIFLGCDNHPLSRQEIMDLVAKSGKFSKKFEGFTVETYSLVPSIMIPQLIYFTFAGTSGPLDHFGLYLAEG